MLVLYFEFQTVFAYINQLNNKSKEKIVSFKGKNVIERIKLLLKEFIYSILFILFGYLFNNSKYPSLTDL